MPDLAPDPPGLTRLEANGDAPSWRFAPAENTDHPMRAVVEQLARDPDSWDAAMAARVGAFFDAAAPNWDEVSGCGGHKVVLADALARGGVPTGGTALELGSGNGRISPVAAAHFSEVVALDLAFEMLRLADPASAMRVQADATCLPLPDASVDVVLAVNMFCFAREAVRVLRPGGRYVWVNGRGANTPIHLSPEWVLDLFRRVGGDTVMATTATCGEGEWCVVRLPEST